MTDLVRLPHYAAPNETEDEWSGWLTTENVVHVAAAIRSLLKGRRFTCCVSYERNGWRPELRTGAALYPGGRPHEVDCVSGYVDEGGTAYVGFSAAAISWSWHTSVREQPEWQETPPDRLEQPVTMVIKRNSLETFNYTPEGKGCRAMFKLEPESRHVRALIELVRKHELTAAADVSTVQLFQLHADAAEQELAGDW